jgi:hypothetical protein
VAQLVPFRGVVANASPSSCIPLLRMLPVPGGAVLPASGSVGQWHELPPSQPRIVESVPGRGDDLT